MDSKYHFNPGMYEIVAKNIKKYRLEKGISVENLSKYADINFDFLERLEKEENATISIYDLYKISVILEVRINHFFEE